MLGDATYDGPVTRPISRRNPLEGVSRLLVDGTNLLHALRRGAGADAAPPAALIGRLRGAIQPETQITLVFDGPPDRGTRGERIAAGVTVQYSCRYTADTILVVTDDRDLRLALRRRGARTAGTQWLLGRLERPRLAAPSIGNARPPAPPRIAQQQPGEATEDEATGRTSWRPGRGATAKTGNPKRQPRARRPRG
jgi:hypothetical protein